MRKRSITLLVIIIFLASIILSGCGNIKTIDNVTYDTYGLINEDEKKNPNIEYKVIWGNIVLAVILCETIVAPIYFVGFDMFEPIGKKDPNKPKGVI